MFLLQQPEVREASVFTRLPNRFRRDDPSEWAEANRPGHVVDSYLEGPVFDQAGNLYVTDIPFGRIFRVNTAGEWTLIIQYDGEPNGLKFWDPRTLLVADYRNGLMRLDIESGEITPHLGRRHSESFRGLNDLVYDRHGNLYFTDQGQTGLHDASGRLYRLTLDGRLDLLLDNIPSPNGVCLSSDEKVLFLAVTRANAVWRVPLQHDGGVAKVGLFFTSYGPSGPDGLAMTCQGHLVVANPGLGFVWLLNERAEPVLILRSPVGTSITNIAFGGTDRRTLYCTESTTGSILTAQLHVAGLALHTAIPSGDTP